MTKTAIFALIVFNIFATVAHASPRCNGFLKTASQMLSFNIETHVDPGVRFSVSRSEKIAAPLNRTSLDLKPNTEVNNNARLDAQALTPGVQSLINTLNLEGSLYKLNASGLFGYLRSFSNPALRENNPVQFVFWEGQGSRIETSTVVKGSLLDVKLAISNPRASNRVETVDHIVLVIAETNAAKEVVQTEVKIPMAFTGEKYQTFSPPRQNPQGQFEGYHWGMLVGVSRAE